MDAAQLQNAEAAEDELRREPTRPARLHLVPPDEEIANPIVDVMVDGSVGGHAGAVGEVVRPTRFRSATTAPAGRMSPVLSIVPILSSSRCTLFRDGLAARYVWPVFRRRCGPNSYPRKSNVVRRASTSEPRGHAPAQDHEVVRIGDDVGRERRRAIGQPPMLQEPVHIQVLSKGLITPPCGVPHLLDRPPVMMTLPPEPRSSTGTFNHMRMR